MSADARPAGEAETRRELFEWCGAVLDTTLLEANLSASDDVIEELTQVVEAHCQTLIARQAPAPVAPDLRALVERWYAEADEAGKYSLRGRAKVECADALLAALEGAHGQ